MMLGIARALLLLVAALTGSIALAQVNMRVEVSARQADGKIIIAGEESQGVIKVGRLNPDGTVDSAFGATGWSSLAVPGEAMVTAIAVDATSRIWIAAALEDAPALVRLGSDGQVDSTFGATSPGISWDSGATGLRINGLGFASDGAILGFGSVVGPEAYPRAAAVRYDLAGLRSASWGEGPHGTRLLATTAPSAFRAATRRNDGTFAAAGYLQGSSRQMLLAGFLADGTPDSNFNFHQQYVTYSAAGLQFDLYGVVSVPGSYNEVVVLGRDGYVEGNRPSSSLIAAYFGYGSLALSMQVRVILDAETFSAGDATAISAFPAPDATSDWIIAGFVRDPDAGRTHFVYTRASVQYGGAYLPWVTIGPRVASDDLLVGAYPTGAQFVAVGTRETPQADQSLVLRYFADTGEFDVQDPTASPDTTPDFQVARGWSLDPVTGAPAQYEYPTLLRITGINVPVTVSVGQALYRVSDGGLCSDPFTSAPSTIVNGQYVCLSVVSASTPNTAVTATLTAGGASTSRTVTTGGPADTSFASVPADPSGPSVQFNPTASTWEGFTGFQCSLDGGPFGSSCSFTGLAGGQHTVAARAVNNWGADPTPAAHTWTVLALPQTTITAAPPANSNSSTATFEFVSDQPTATFECMTSFASGGFSPCTSPATYSGLEENSHWFYVRAVNAVGTDASPATHSWATDYRAPSIQMYATPDMPGGTSGNPTSSTGGTIHFSALGEFTARPQCRLDDAAFADCTSPYTLSGVTEGAHRFDVRAIDASGNTSAPSSHYWSVDLTNPGTSFVAIDTTGASATFDFQATETATFECRLDGAAFAACTRPVTLTGLTAGAHTFEARAVDAAGNRDATPASHAWTVDTTAPETTITVHPPAITQSSTARFEMASNESGVSFQCRLDAGAWASCPGNGPQYPDLLPGSHTFEARATDAGGNIDATPASFTWTIDFSYGPETAIASGPSGTVATTSATFTFNSPSGTPAVGFRCTFGGSIFECTSPWTVNGLADGEHNFSVGAYDAEGNIDRTAATRSWNVDTSAPDTTITSGPSGTTAQGSATFAFTATDPAATFQCSLDSGTWSVCTSGASFSGLADGMHLFEVRAVDVAGNADPTPATRTWSVDTTNPNTTITSGPDAVTSQTSATLAFTASEGATFQCKLDAAAYAGCTSPQVFAGLSAGAHAFSVYSVDAAGNVDASPATWSWFIDTAAPETTITSAPSGTVTSTSASIAFSSPESGMTFECSLDGAAFAACVSPVNLAGLTDGAHAFQVRAKDAAGNVDSSPAAASWTVDATAPNTSFTASPPAASSSTSASFSFTATESATFECKLDAGAYAACTSPKAYSGLANGSHTFSVRARDAAGNQDASAATFTWTVDTVAPNTTIASGPNGNNNTNPVTFAFTSTEGGTFQCKMDTGAFEACTTPKQYTGLTKGQHTFQVRAVDAAGNADASPASRNFGVK